MRWPVIIVTILGLNASAIAAVLRTPSDTHLLNMDSSRVCVKWSNEIDSIDLAAIEDSFELESVKVAARTFPNRSRIYSVDSAKYEAIVSLYPETALKVQFCYSYEDVSIPIDEYFYAQFTHGTTREIVDSINALSGVEIVYTSEWMPNVYLLRVRDENPLNTLECAASHDSLEQVEFAVPDFPFPLEPLAYTLTDVYEQFCGHVKKVIGHFNDSSVWDFHEVSSPVTTAIIDDGIAPHEDLPSSRILPGRDFTDSPNGTLPGTTRGHGMACAGILAASHTVQARSDATSSGIISLNPQVSVLPVKVTNDEGLGPSPFILAEAINYAWRNGADVISVSLAYGIGLQPESIYILGLAVDSATNSGRSGKGSLYVNGAGNSGFVAYPARYDNAIAVGAIKLSDTVWGYSGSGTALDIVAPSGDLYHCGDVFSVDQMGTAGYNNQLPGTCTPWECGFSESYRTDNDPDYNCKFGGTSAAAPIVAGIATLLLSRDPNLTVEQLDNILKQSAVRTLDWGSVTAPDDFYGYGRADAFRAVLSISKGDCDNDGSIDISDITALQDHLFISNEPLFPSTLLGDVTCEGEVDIGDLTVLIDHLFISLEPLPYPCFGFD